MDTGQAFLLLETTATVFMAGVLWTVQLLNYPLLALVGTEAFPRYEAAHNRRFALVVVPGRRPASWRCFWSWSFPRRRGRAPGWVRPACYPKVTVNGIGPIQRCGYTLDREDQHDRRRPEPGPQRR